MRTPVLVALLLLSSAARADEPEPSEPHAESLSFVSGSAVDPRSYANDWLVAPPGGNVGGALRMISAGTGPSGSAIGYSDLALLTLHGRWTVANRLELSGGIDLLSKQPDDRRDTVFQAGDLGVKVATSRRTAFTAGTAAGPTMGDDGAWGRASVGAVHRSPIERVLALQISGGGEATALRQDGMGRRWLAELAFASQLVLHTPRGEAALWGGVDMGFPIAHSSRLDPTSRLGLGFGAVYSAVRDWDLYFEMTFRDRGTLAMPETTLPIIDGGFDQRQLVFGITRRFSARGTNMWMAR
jgi:hypothetical protein